MTTARQIARDVLGRTLRGSYWEADKALTALAAAGFVVIQPTDPEVIERAGRAYWTAFGMPECEALKDGDDEHLFAMRAALAALGEPADHVPSIAQAMANDPTDAEAEGCECTWHPAGRHVSACTEKCWTPIPCPDHGNEMNPRGRDAGMRAYDCCENRRDSQVNPRHLWDEHDSTRHYTDPEGWAAHEAACPQCRGEEES